MVSVSLCQAKGQGAPSRRTDKARLRDAHTRTQAPPHSPPTLAFTAHSPREADKYAPTRDSDPIRLSSDPIPPPPRAHTHILSRTDHGQNHSHTKDVRSAPGSHCNTIAITIIGTDL